MVILRIFQTKDVFLCDHFNLDLHAQFFCSIRLFSRNNFIRNKATNTSNTVNYSVLFKNILKIF